MTRLSMGPHSHRARLDAETLLLHLLGRNKAWLMAHANEDVSDEVCCRYMKVIERRFHGEPIQYITGECEFYGLPFRITRDVLIPRPETEHLVERAIELAANFEHPRILDVGTGSGAIAVALAHALPGAHIAACDVSPASLAIAKQNAARNQVPIRFLQGDLLDPVTGESFDLVVSNPPYVSLADRDTLSVEVRDHEPPLALFASDDGLAVYRRLIPAAFRSLVPGGHIVLEIGFGQENAVRALLAAAGFHTIHATPDLQGIPRVLSAMREKG
jgi:release factor glutamine methyltransferase